MMIKSIKHIPLRRLWQKSGAQSVITIFTHKMLKKTCFILKILLDNVSNHKIIESILQLHKWNLYDWMKTILEQFSMDLEVKF